MPSWQYFTCWCLILMFVQSAHLWATCSGCLIEVTVVIALSATELDPQRGAGIVPLSDFIARINVKEEPQAEYKIVLRQLTSPQPVFMLFVPACIWGFELAWMNEWISFFIKIYHIQVLHWRTSYCVIMKVEEELFGESSYWCHFCPFENPADRLTVKVHFCRFHFHDLQVSSSITKF